MKQDICTIPINEVFEKKDGCPICRMRAELEERALDFVMGPAMMEPDVRHETNRLGFCPEHLDIMCGRGNRLPLALMLESHLAEIDNAVFESHRKSLLHSTISQAAASAGDAKKIAESCYICDRIKDTMDREFATMWKLWKKEEEFRRSVAAQSIICLSDYALLVEKGLEALDKKSFEDFYEVISGVARKGLEGLKGDVSGFCGMYDYHNNGTDFGTLRNAVKNSVSYLTGRIHK
ncbi:MAG TPA: DUF6062 family protein [Ruminiclostridium sp.]|nr:DUF6062 family protein [Ruminiclostridium sp.]